ncbi:MAG: ferredoxin [bacterium]|nr:ferredoxin [bacterium]
MFKIIHERKKCISCGACALVCPAIFEMSEEDNLATLKNSKEDGDGVFELETDNADCAKEAIAICPVNVIKIQE